MSRKRWDEILQRLPEDRCIVGAEVGVWRGGLSRRLLQARPHLTLFMADMWVRQDDDSSYVQSGDDKSGVSQDEYDKARWYAMSATDPFEQRRVVLWDDSVDAAKAVEDNTLDFCFIDGDHSYNGVMRDLCAWWPKVKRGGWIGGHDWENDAHKHWGVKRAVLDYLIAIDRKDCIEQIQLGEDHTWFLNLP